MLVEAGFPQQDSFRGRGEKEGHQNPPPHLESHSHPPEMSRRMLQSVKEPLSDFCAPCLIPPAATEGSVLTWAPAD